MNANGLAKHYDQLTPWERVPLIFAAHRRGDTAEGERLAHAAPAHTFRIPDHYGLSEGLRLLAVAVRLQQLDLAAFFWRLETFVAGWSAGPPDPESAARVERLTDVQRWVAYRFLVQRDAWPLLCCELHIPPDFADRSLPGSDHVAHLADEARALAFTPDEALDYCRRRWETAEAAAGRDEHARRVYRLQSAADVARQWRAYLDDHRKEWA